MKIIALPIYIPILTNLITNYFAYQFWIYFVLKCNCSEKVNQNLNKNEDLKVSFIIVKNEEKNIKLFEKEIAQGNKKNEYLFGNDNSEDQTDFEINKLSKKLIGYNIIKYQGPGVCKSENVYKGIENSTGEIIVIYDADLTVSFSDIEFQ